MTFPRITRRLALAAALALGVASCGAGDDNKAGGAPSEITFSILSAEGQASSGPMWQPLLDDMSKTIGVEVKPYFGSNYTVLVEAMRGGHTQVAWFSAKPALEAVDRAEAEVIARIVDPEGRDPVQVGCDIAQPPGAAVVAREHLVHHQALHLSRRIAGHRHLPARDARLTERSRLSG